MSESGRKRCRKDKLVPRDCPAFFDDDSVLQTPPQKRLLLQKIKKEPDDYLLSQEASSLEFSIKVEVEDIEDTLPDEDPSDYMQYLFSLSKESSSNEPSSSLDKHKEIDEDSSYILDVNKIYKLLPSLHKKYPNDKEVAISSRNAWGKVFYEKNEELPLTSQENELQEIIAEWRNWHLISSKTRESPFSYKCYICSHAWWHFIDFRDHIKIHPESTIKLELVHQECNVICFGTAVQPPTRQIYVDGKCTKCAKTYKEHLESKRFTEYFYYCTHCKEKFQTCVALNRHVGACDRNPIRTSAMLKDIMNAESNFMEYVCKVCDIVFLSKPEQIEHMSVCHRVRSDVPIANNVKICCYCRKPYYFFAFHVCTKRNINHACKYCHSMFHSRQMVEIHNRMWKKKSRCRICCKILMKQCMEAEHYASHSDNFLMMYRCLTCKKLKVFQCADAVRNHHTRTHRRFDSRRPGWEKIIVPKIMLEQCLFNPNIRQKKRLRTPSLKASVKTGPETAKGRNERNSKELYRQYTPRYRNTAVDENNDTTNKTNEASNDKTPEDVNVDKSKNDSSVLEQITESLDIKPDIVKVKEEVCDEDLNADLITYTFEPESNTDSQTDIHTDTKANKVFQSTEVNDVAKVFQVSQSLLEPETILIKQEIKEEPLDDDDLILINQSNESIKQESIDSDSSGLSLHKLEPDVILKAGYRKRKVYKCSKCDFEGYHKEYKEHVNNMCMKVSKKKAELPGEFNFKCTKCNHCYSSLKGYVHHFVEHNYKYLTCPQCGDMFDSISKLMPHMNGHIKNQFVRIHKISENGVSEHKKAFQCKTCKEITNNTELFVHWEKHLVIFVEPQPEEVEVVRRGDRTEYALEPQALQRILDLLQKPPRHDGSPKKVKQCFICHRKFERQNDCKRHLIEHLLEDAYASVETNKELKCQICKEQYKKPDEYKKHMRDHASLPVYQCALCNKTFSDSSNFTKHKKIHNLEAFMCDICKKKFQVKSSLERHIQMHMVTEPIQCDLCTRVFHERSFYNRHKRQFHDRSTKHTKCIICKKRFNSLKDKWDHLWDEHKLRKEKADCPICQKEYRKFSDVKKHCQTEHSLNIHMEDIIKLMKEYNLKEGNGGKSVEINYVRRQTLEMLMANGGGGDEDSDDDVLLIEEERETLVIYDDDVPT